MAELRRALLERGCQTEEDLAWLKEPPYCINIRVTEIPGADGSVDTCVLFKYDQIRTKFKEVRREEAGRLLTRRHHTLDQ